MEIVVDLDPEVVQMLDIHRSRYQTDRSSFLNYMIALYDQNTRQHQQQQVQYQQPAQSYQQSYQPMEDDSGYLGPIEPVQNVKQLNLHRQSNASLRSILHGNGNLAPHGTRPKNTVVKSQSKTLPKRTRR
jgi:hypothetical protein